MLDKQAAADGPESRRQDAEDRVLMAGKAMRTPGFPKPLPAEIEAAERELQEAIEECDRVHAELRDIDVELGIL